MTRPAQRLDRSRRTAGGLADGTRLRVGGNPTAEEIAAVLLALDQAAAQDAAARHRPRPPAWQRAARLEGLGHRRVVTPRDLGR